MRRLRGGRRRDDHPLRLLAASPSTLVPLAAARGSARRRVDVLQLPPRAVLDLPRLRDAGRDLGNAALCGADDDDSSCPYNGCCHIECMPPAERPKVEVDSDEEDAAAAKPAAPPPPPPLRRRRRRRCGGRRRAADGGGARGVGGAPSKPKPPSASRRWRQVRGRATRRLPALRRRSGGAARPERGCAPARGTKGSAWPKRSRCQR